MNHDNLLAVQCITELGASHTPVQTAAVEDVTMTVLTNGSRATDDSTFMVPFTAGSISISCSRPVQGQARGVYIVP